MSFCYVDTETMGLSLEEHDIWEIAFAIDDGPIESSVVHHDTGKFQQVALDVNHYAERMHNPSLKWETDMFSLLQGLKVTGQPVTLVGANVPFDAYRLSKRWGGEEPWNYRMVDLESYAMPLMQVDYPRGLFHVAQFLRTIKGHNIPEPDHTAAGDVATARACHQALQQEYANA